MLRTLEICGYRGFRSYQLSDFERINLIVGKNDCGKTSILEAIELLVSGGRPPELFRSLRRRDEFSAFDRAGAPSVSHIFYGHECEQGADLKILANQGMHSLEINLLSLDEFENSEDPEPRFSEWIKQDLFEFAHEPITEIPHLLGMKIVSSNSQKHNVVPVFADGRIHDDYHKRLWYSSKEDETPLRFLASDSISPESIGEMWNTVLADGMEDEIVNDLQLLEPDLASIHFLTRGRYGGGILVGLQSSGARVPIGSLGDGIRRLFSLRLSFVGAANGFLLIDEIDTGLHWTVMKDMWKLVVEVAQKLDVQVFATSHSDDCVRGLGRLLRGHPELVNQVAIQKVDGSLTEAVCVRGDQIPIAVEQGIEVR